MLAYTDNRIQNECFAPAFEMYTKHPDMLLTLFVKLRYTSLNGGEVRHSLGACQNDSLSPQSCPECRDTSECSEVVGEHSKHNHAGDTVL